MFEDGKPVRDHVLVSSDPELIGAPATVPEKVAISHNKDTPLQVKVLHLKFHLQVKSTIL